MSNSKKVSDAEIYAACEESLSMARACVKVGLHYNTFIRRAKEIGCYHPNQSGKGIKKKCSLARLIPLSDILEGKHPQYQSYMLKNRLLREGLKKAECEICNNIEWNDLPIPLELDHIDGNSRNHKLHNLRLLCPNCHAQTETYCSKNKKNSLKQPVKNYTYVNQ